MRIFITLILVTLFLSAQPSSTFAQEKQSDQTPITKWIAAENAMIEALPKENQKVFFVMRNKYNVIRSVRMVERDIKNAVQSCAKENKDIKDEINTRFDEWQNAIDPILKDANSFLDKELKQQKAFHVSDFKVVSKLNDKAFNFSEKQIEKKPVSSLKSCKSLIKSMNRSENQLVDLLQTILIPEEVVRKRLKRDEKAAQ